MIADKAKLIGTVRTFDEDVRKFVEKEMERVIKGTCYAADRGYPSVVNHLEETNFLIRCANEIPNVSIIEEAEPSMGGEDFAYYLQHVKGTFFLTGAKPTGIDKAYPHHHLNFDIDENAMLVAAKTLGTAEIKYHDQ